MTRPMPERFRLECLVDLGDGWARLPEPGDEVYRFHLRKLDLRLAWMDEVALLREAGTLSYWGPDDVEIESMVVPGPAPAQAEEPDPRQLTLPIEAA